MALYKSVYYYYYYYYKTLPLPLYPQNGDRVVTIDSVTSLSPCVYSVQCVSMQAVVGRSSCRLKHATASRRSCDVTTTSRSSSRCDSRPPVSEPSCPSATNTSSKSAAGRHFTSRRRSHRLSAIISSELHVRSSPNAICGRGSVLLWRRDDTLCTSGFIDDVIFAHKARLLDVAAQQKRSAHAALGLAISCAQ